MVCRCGVLLGLLIACSPAGRAPKDAPSPIDASVDAVALDAWPPPPSVDAGPPPTMTCDGDAGVGCELPPSTCLDENYIAYYTGGTCNAGTCEYETNLMYCPTGCELGGCRGGFT